MKTVCVLLSVYNGEKYLDQQINSILNQEKVKVVLIARNDGSTDTSIKILNKYCDSITILDDVNIGIQNRFNKSVQYIRKAIESGRFGKLSHGTAHVRWNRGKSYYSQASWRGTWAQDGGCLMNQCIHNIDLLRWMMGDDVEEVIAYTDQLEHPYLETEDLGMALVKFSNGSYGLIEGTTNVYPQNLEETLYIFGEKGTAKAAGTSNNIIEEWKFADGLDDPDEVKKNFSENPPNIYGFGHIPLYKDVIEAIKNHRAPLVDAEAGKRALELVLAIYKAAAEHRSVKFPLDNCSTLDFIGRFNKEF